MTQQGSSLLRISIAVASVLSLSTAMLASAGGGSSGGGKTVVCRNDDGSISKAYLLDLYEAAARWGLQIKPPTGDITSEYARYLLELRRVVGDPRPFGDDDDVSLGEKISKLRFGFDLPPVTDDLGTTIPLPKRCKVEQAITHSDETDELLADPWIWQALDTQNQAALLAHEELYFGARQAGELTSEAARQTVAELFSTTPPPVLSDRIPNRYLACDAGAANGRIDDTKFAAYPDPLNSEHTILQFSKLFGRDVYTPTTITIPEKVDLSSLNYAYPEGRGWPTINVRPGKGSTWNTFTVPDGAYKGYKVNVRFQAGSAFELLLIESQKASPKRTVATFCFNKSKVTNPQN